LRRGLGKGPCQCSALSTQHSGVRTFGKLRHYGGSAIELTRTFVDALLPGSDQLLEYNATTQDDEAPKMKILSDMECRGDFLSPRAPADVGRTWKAHEGLEYAVIHYCSESRYEKSPTRIGAGQSSLSGTNLASSLTTA
jgi:hypothetical protein